MLNSENYHPFKNIQHTVLLAVLILLGVAGNYFGLPLLDGVEILWGSITVLIVVRLFAVRWGVITAIIVNSLSFGLDPAYLVISVAEALVVGIALRKREENLLLLDGVFWFGVGIPMGLLFYFGFQDLNIAEALFKVLKQGLNGIANALVANLLLTLIPFLTVKKLATKHQDAPFQQIFFNILIATIIGFTTTMLYVDNRKEQMFIEQEITSFLDYESNQLSRHIVQIQSYSFDKQKEANLIQQTIQGSVQGNLIGGVTLRDQQGNIVAKAENKLIGITKGKADQVNWQNSSYTQETVLVNGNGLLQLQVPVAPYQNKLQVNLAKNMALLLAVFCFIFTLAATLSKKLNQPIAQLAQLTTNLPEKIINQVTIEWPRSLVRENNLLIDNFKSMVQILEQNFKSLNTQNSFQQNLIDTIPIPIFYKNTQGEYLGCNAAYQECFRTSKQALLGKTVYDIAAKDLADQYYAMDQALFAQPGTQSYECAVIYADGIKREVIFNKGTFNDHEGKLAGLIGVIVDITQRKRAEEELTNQQANLLKQLNYAKALNKLADKIINSEVANDILKNLIEVLGNTLQLDQTSIFEVNVDNSSLITLGSWENPTGPKVISPLVSYNLNKFKHMANYWINSRGYIESHVDDINPLISQDELGIFLHQRLGLQSLLWYPFAFHAGGCYLLTFNQLTYRRDWQTEEINFLESVSSQVSIAMQKMRYLDEGERIKNEIWEEKERAQITLHSIGDAVITTNAEGRVEYLNPVAEVLTGWPTSEARGIAIEHVLHLISETSGQSIDNPVTQCILEGRTITLSNQAVLVHRNGHKFAIEDTAAPIKNFEGAIIGAVLVFHDVTEKRNMLNQMVHQAHHDPLTGLPNRILFADHLKLALAQAKQKQEQLAVMFLDLDQFKYINDILGHPVGDQLLKGVAQRLKDCLFEYDTISRLGGDEFTVLLPRIVGETVALVARKVLAVLQQPWFIEQQEYTVTASIGIAVFPNDGEDAETLMMHADTAMYRAKEEGKNNYQFYTPIMNQKISARLALENNMRRALRDEHFTVYFQPLVDTSSYKIYGAEALVRWSHPELGMISPGEFIPLAEETGLIIPLGEWVLKTACAHNKAWQDAGYVPIHITVNISTNQFMQQDFVRKVSLILEQTGLEPCWLGLEITESVAMQDIDLTIKVLKELKAMGISISIDDFGTGYSSLSYLKKLPIDTLKIDRSFVSDVPGDPDDEAIINSVIGLAQNLHLKVIAEGVETIEQRDFLQAKQCDNMQGFLFYKPMPAQELAKLLEQGHGTEQATV